MSGPSNTQRGAIDIALGDVAKLEEVVDREALTQVCRSFFELFSLSVRIFSSSGRMPASSSTFSTPTCAMPLAAPPLSTRPTRGRAAEG